MSATEFLTPFHALDISEGTEINRLQLEQPFRVYLVTLSAIVEVPSGFVFNESIPQAAQVVSPLFGASKRAACIHDWLYRNAGYIDADGRLHPVTRSQADDCYLEICIAAGLPKWRSRFRWAVLRAVGWKAWNENRKNDKPAETVKL